MKGYIFPGQGSQFAGMAKELYSDCKYAKELFDQANEILEFPITEMMFGDNPELLKETKVTQPAVFLHSVILSNILGESFQPDMVAGHSLGEFSALVASKYLSFEDGLILVKKRALAMQKACEIEPSTMAAILGLENKIVEEVCSEIDEIVVPANYNCNGQLVISGSIKGIDIACEKLIEKGAKRALKIPVGGAFHSPFMESAKKELEEAIKNTDFTQGICPIYQNVKPKPITNPDEIKKNLIKQLTSSVQWTQIMQKMIEDGLENVIEVGPGKVLQGLFKKTNREIPTESAIYKV
ncbi:MAG: ACP S-malonyltransferase [Bacteroidota bacterium]|nr:ACP S-malonyltransferase [Bacteroidota bacterium]